MLIVFAVTVGVIFACGVYLMLRRSMVRLIIGLSLITYAVNLLIFSVDDLRTRAAPIIDAVPEEQMADPLPQALILTAIVISFGMLAFSLALAYRASQVAQTDSIDALQNTDSDL
jgi:multicomponent Na+:H+ antiporter subunit C